MPETRSPNGEAFALERLRDHPEASFDEVRRHAEHEGLALLPIQYGRARRRLGLTQAGPPTARAADDGERAPRAAPPKAPGPRSGSGRKGSPDFEYLVEQLRAEPTLSYGELKARADERGVKIAPIMYGRAKALLGLVPVRPRGQGKNRKPPAIRRPGGASSGAPADLLVDKLDGVRSVDELVRIVRELDAERRRLRTVLEQVAATIREALSED